jgi:hypothetical protein
LDDAQEEWVSAPSPFPTPILPWLARRYGPSWVAYQN